MIVSDAAIYVNNQYNEIQELERSVSELHQLLIDFSVLVELQGELLINISHNVSKAVDYVDSGNRDLSHALESQIGIRMLQLAPGLLIQNKSESKILVILSQITPLHWEEVDSGETRRIHCGRVFFTVSADIYNEKKVPTIAGNIARFTGITIVGIASAAVMPGIVVPAGVAMIAGSVASGESSARGAKEYGVYADGKTIIFNGRTCGKTGHYKIYYEGMVSSGDSKGEVRRDNPEPAKAKSKSMLSMFNKYLK